MSKHDALKSLVGKIHQRDCVTGMQQIPDGEVDLVFADPPFNIGYDYDVYDDRLEADKYLDWSTGWMAEVFRILKPNGTFWLAIGDEYAADLKVSAASLGFHCRSWVIWYYTFGVHCTNKFTRSHAHLFHFVKDPADFVFNNDSVRVPSARQLVYADKRANSKGRMPDDTWILRPQDLVDGFNPGEDVWYFPRVAGTFKERAGFHGCQMPEQLLGRIIRSCTNEDDVVMDPFSGSATTVAVAKKLGRRWFSFELSEEYVDLGTDRLTSIAAGDPLDGSKEPKVSAPATVDGKTRKKTKGAASKGFRQGKLDFLSLSDHDEPMIGAFAEINDGFSVDRVIADPILCEDFQQVCDRRDVPGNAAERNRQIFRLRKAGKLKAAGIDTTQRTHFSWEHLSQYIFASEIAWRQLSDQYPQRSLDELFCDPRLAAQFDTIASRFAPGFTPLEYRWAALTLRKKSNAAKTQARKHKKKELELRKFDHATTLKRLLADLDQIPNGPGVYAIHDGNDCFYYAGETSNLRERLKSHFNEQSIAHWESQGKEIEVSHQQVDTVDDYRLARQCYLLKWYKPAWNLVDQFSL